MTQDVAQEAVGGRVPSDADVMALMDELQIVPGRNLIGLFQQVQERFGYLPPAALAQISRRTKMPLSRVYGVVTFYAHFALEPRGKHIVRLCNGTACHVKQSIRLLEALRRRLGLDGDESTTPDMLFTIEIVSCLGACGLAPVLVVNDSVHGQMSPDKVVKLMDDILAREANGHA